VGGRILPNTIDEQLAFLEKQRHRQFENGVGSRWQSPDTSGA
jgi:hypothetical protein